MAEIPTSHTRANAASRLAERPAECPIIAVATPTSGAIAVIRCSGADSIGILGKRFSPSERLLRAEPSTIHHGRIVDARGTVLDDVLVATYRAPSSYTGEESAEIFCHGGVAGVKLIFQALLSAGFVAAEPGEFTRRAFLNGKLDLTRAEAVNELVRAQTASAHALAIERLRGGVERVVEQIRSALIRVMAGIAAQLDYPEEETPDAAVDAEQITRIETDLRNLAATYERGRILQEGIRVVIAGRTNAGKSSLFNQILRIDRSIVSDTHGTTRDYVEALVDIGGIPVRLFDTAGLRESSEPIETEGMRRTDAVLAAAEVVLYVVGADAGLVPEDQDRLDAISPTPCITVWNKNDLGVGDPPVGAVVLSAKTGRGIDELNRAIEQSVLPSSETGQVVIDSARQHNLLIVAADALGSAADSLTRGLPVDAVAVEIQDAVTAIGEITGRH
jgi:tRNA modification GTPase